MRVATRAVLPRPRRAPRGRAIGDGAARSCRSRRSSSGPGLRSRPPARACDHDRFPPPATAHELIGRPARSPLLRFQAEMRSEASAPTTSWASPPTPWVPPALRFHSELPCSALTQPTANWKARAQTGRQRAARVRRGRPGARPVGAARRGDGASQRNRPHRSSPTRRRPRPATSVFLNATSTPAWPASARHRHGGIPRACGRPARPRPALGGQWSARRPLARHQRRHHGRGRALAQRRLPPSSTTSDLLSRVTTAAKRPSLPTPADDQLHAWCASLTAGSRSARCHACRRRPPPHGHRRCNATARGS